VQAERELSRSNTTTPTRRHPDRGLRVKQVELHNGLIRLTKKNRQGANPADHFRYETAAYCLRVWEGA